MKMGTLIEGKYKRIVKPLGNTEITYISDVFKGEIMDTEVTIHGYVICWIAGTEIDAFHEQLSQLINKYRI